MGDKAILGTTLAGLSALSSILPASYAFTQLMQNAQNNILNADNQSIDIAQKNQPRVQIQQNQQQIEEGKIEEVKVPIHPKDMPKVRPSAQEQIKNISREQRQFRNYPNDMGELHEDEISDDSEMLSNDQQNLLFTEIMAENQEVPQSERPQFEQWLRSILEHGPRLRQFGAILTAMGSQAYEIYQWQQEHKFLEKNKDLLGSLVQERMKFNQDGKLIGQEQVKTDIPGEEIENNNIDQSDLIRLMGTPVPAHCYRHVYKDGQGQMRSLVICKAGADQRVYHNN